MRQNDHTKMTNHMTAAKFRCECGWEGTESQMESDHTGGVDEMWSNHICPSCRTWWSSVDDYTEIRQTARGAGAVGPPPSTPRALALLAVLFALAVPLGADPWPVVRDFPRAGTVAPLLPVGADPDISVEGVCTAALTPDEQFLIIKVIRPSGLANSIGAPVSIPGTLLCDGQTPVRVEARFMTDPISSACGHLPCSFLMVSRVVDAEDALGEVQSK